MKSYSNWGLKFQILLLTLMSAAIVFRAYQVTQADRVSNENTLDEIREMNKETNYNLYIVQSGLAETWYYLTAIKAVTTTCDLFEALDIEHFNFPRH